MSESHIKSTAYDEAENLLTVTFGGGHVTLYHPVNPENYVEVIKADCLDRAINKLIRTPSIVGIAQKRGH
jgi:hypothetical protein